MTVLFKSESETYRTLRDKLLEAEIALKNQTERVEALRRQLPEGPLVETDYFVSCTTVWGELMFRIKSTAEGKTLGPLFARSGMAY